MRHGYNYTTGFSAGEFDFMRCIHDLNEILEIIESFKKKRINNWLHNARAGIEFQGDGPLVAERGEKLVLNANLWLKCGWERQYNIVSSWVSEQAYKK